MSRSLPTRAALERAADHWPEVVGLAYLLVRDRGRAEELGQEAYLRLARLGGRLDVSRPLRPLLLTTVRRLAWNERRRRRMDELEEADVIDDRAPTPIERMAAGEERGAVRDALAGLLPAWREAVFLRDGLALSYREIAGVLGTSEDVVRTTLHRARARVREALLPHLLPEDRS